MGRQSAKMQVRVQAQTVPALPSCGVEAGGRQGMRRFAATPLFRLPARSYMPHPSGHALRSIRVRSRHDVDGTVQGFVHGFGHTVS